MKILIIDDEHSLCFALTELFKENGYFPNSVNSFDDALSELKNNPYDAAIIDYQLKNKNGLDLLSIIKKEYPYIYSLFITGFGSEKIAIESIKRGAYDYIAKPFDNVEMLNIVGNIKKLIDAKKESIIKEYFFSPKMLALAEKINTIAPLTVPVLITGESGTGKEVLAKLIHKRSGRKGKFVAVNCSAIPESLIESEFFGAEKGSFTNSINRKTGFFEMSDNGTIFLDEIGDMPFPLQVKLLRVIQEGEICRIGNPLPVKIDIKIIAATNKNIEAEVKNKTFREDLFYRLNVIRFEIPPLRERKEEIEKLAMIFLSEFNCKYEKEINGFETGLMEKMIGHPWLGNIRELKNVIEQSVIFCGKELITENELKLENIDQDSNINNSKILEEKTFSTDYNFNSLPENITIAKKAASAAFEKKFILYHLDKNKWNVSQTAEKIGMFRQDLYKKMKRHNIQRD